MNKYIKNSYIKLIMIKSSLKRAHYGVLGERAAQVNEVVDVGARAPAAPACSAPAPARL